MRSKAYKNAHKQGMSEKQKLDKSIMLGRISSGINLDAVVKEQGLSINKSALKGERNEE